MNTAALLHGGEAVRLMRCRVTLEELLARCPEFAVDVDQGRYAEGSHVRRHLSLPWPAC